MAIHSLFSIPNIKKGLVMVAVIICYWWFFWPIYEISVGIQTFETLLANTQQFGFFLVGAIVTVPSIFIWKKVIL